MKKLLVGLLAVSSLTAFASELDMSKLYCNDMQLTAATTLADVQKNCGVSSQKEITYNIELGMYEVKFVNTATGQKVKCDFAESTPSSKLNGCR